MDIINIEYQDYNRDNLMVLSIENENYSNMLFLDNQIQEYINLNNINKQFSICLKDISNDYILAFCLFLIRDNGIDNSIKFVALGFCDTFTKERISNQALFHSCFDGSFDCLWYTRDNIEILPTILTDGFINNGNVNIRYFNQLIKQGNDTLLELNK